MTRSNKFRSFSFLFALCFTYDGFGQMTSSYVNGVTTTYAYRADGLRKSKTANGVITRHVWDGDQIVQDRTGWYTTTEYVRGIRLIDTFTYGDYARFTYIQNARGDVVGFVDGLTSIADTVDYDGFGTYESYTPTNPLGYCGEYRDAETGFIYLRARYYDPSIGRFTTEDPARDGLNWYAYCANNPVNFVDPWGLAPTVMEAAYMAEHIYNASDRDRGADLGDNFGGWKLEKIKTNDEGLKIGVYSRTIDGKTEYALVNKGSTTRSDWINNFQQPIGLSTDMKDSIQYAKDFVAEKFGYEVTMVGHSKGGAEAAANAIETNTNAILFNPAELSVLNVGFDIFTYTANITAYVVFGDPLDAYNRCLAGYGLPYRTEFLPFFSINPLKNHSMEAIIAGLSKMEENGK